MFKADRVGTPAFSDQGGTTNTAAWTVTSDLITAASWRGNVINAAPGGELSQNQIQWSGAARTIPAGERMSFIQQFTIKQPIDGNIVGVEVYGGFFGFFSAPITPRPIFGKLQAPGASLWAPVIFALPPVPVDVPWSAAAATIVPTYRSQVVHKEDRSTLPGTYAHGFQLLNTSGGAITFTVADIRLAQRQMPYLEGDPGYFDTLR